MRHLESVPLLNNPYYPQLYSFPLHGHYLGFLYQEVIMTGKNSKRVKTAVVLTPPPHKNVNILIS